MLELAEARSSMWRLLVKLPPGLTGLLLRGDLLTLCGDLSLRGELWRLLPMNEVLWPECENQKCSLPTRQMVVLVRFMMIFRLMFILPRTVAWCWGEISIVMNTGTSPGLPPLPVLRKDLIMFRR